MDNDREQVKALLVDYVERRMSRRQVLARALALGVGASALSGLLAACAKDTPPATSTSGSSGSGTTSTAASSGAAAETATLTPRAGGTFIEAYPQDFSKVTTVNAAWIDPTHDALLEPLVSADPDGKIVPNLVASWEVNEDATLWTFKLRDNLKFHSGQPVTTAHVVEDFELFRGPTGQNTAWWKSVTEVAEGPDNTVIVKCNRPFAAFPDTLRNQFSNIFNNQTAQSAGDEYGAKMVDGTGPFTLKEFVPGSHVLAERWEEYPGTGVPWFENKGKAYLDGIRWVPVLEKANMANELISGNVHAGKNPLPQDLEAIKSNPDLVVIEMQESASLVLGLNHTKTQLGFDDLRVRQAISHAIDRVAIVKTILMGHGVPNYGPYPSAYKWYEPGVEAFNQYDLAKAEALLDAAGWQKGADGVREKGGVKLAFEIINQADATRDQVGQAISAMLKKVGVNATVSNLEAGAFFGGLGSDPDAFFFQWLWISPPDLLTVLAHTDFQPAPNWAKASLPDVDQALDSWRYARKDAELKTAARKSQLVIAEQLPVISLYTPNVVWVHNKKVHGWRPTPSNIYPFYNDVWLEE